MVKGWRHISNAALRDKLGIAHGEVLDLVWQLKIKIEEKFADDTGVVTLSNRTRRIYDSCDILQAGLSELEIRKTVIVGENHLATINGCYEQLTEWYQPLASSGGPFTELWHHLLKALEEFLSHVKLTQKGDGPIPSPAKRLTPQRLEESMKRGIDAEQANEVVEVDGSAVASVGEGGEATASEGADVASRSPAPGSPDAHVFFPSDAFLPHISSAQLSQASRTSDPIRRKKVGKRWHYYWQDAHRRWPHLLPPTPPAAQV